MCFKMYEVEVTVTLKKRIIVTNETKLKAKEQARYAIREGFVEPTINEDYQSSDYAIMRERELPAVCPDCGTPLDCRDVGAEGCCNVCGFNVWGFDDN
ncbi:hypothetical protein EVA_12913 [gut metagenome]|uniref:Uncharacterized protein n=1 Tax=gut metagenome TaxID=749906 RepID=J9GB30_9ZZZZ